MIESSSSARTEAEIAVSKYGELGDLYRSSSDWKDRTIASILQDWAARQPTALAVATIEGAMTYEELDRRSDALALGLVDAGLVPGDPVMFQLGNELETIVAWYGVLKAGLVPVCSIPNHRLHEMSLIAGATGARGHIFQANYRNYDLAGLSTELEERCPEVGVRVVARGTSVGGARSMEELEQGADPARARAVVDAIQRELSAEGVAVFQLTSGTTGVPKVIPHTHATYLSIAERWSSTLGWDENSVNLHFIPIMHHAGLGTIMTPTHFSGGTMVIGRAVDAKILVDLIEKYRVTCFHFNQAAAEPLLEYSSQVKCDFSSLTHFVCTWGPMNPPLAAQMEELLGAPGLGSFGMGEGVHLIARRDDPVEIRLHTLGWVIGPHDEVVLRHPEGEDEVPDGELGEFTFRGPSVIRSYLVQDDANAASFTSDGFLRSGDLGRVHVIEGRRCYTLDGRLKDQINRGGEKFMANELEILLLEHPDVREIAAIGFPDPKLGERVCVVVVPDLGCKSSAEELRQRLVTYLDQRDVAKFKWPEMLVLVDELPKTGTGKIQKKVLRDRIVSEAEASEVRS
jgi:2,3-dihydroxybenzoate-AMP ligase